MYQHTQRGTLVLTVIGIAAAVIASIFFAKGFDDPAVMWIISIVMVIMAVVAFMFASLTVKVAKDELIVFFGPGLIKITYLISDISAVEEVRNHWYYGWGVRYTPHGWLYTVSGFDAVQIHLRNGRQYRIGTDEPRELAAVLRQVIESPEERREGEDGSVHPTE